MKMAPITIMTAALLGLGALMTPAATAVGSGGGGSSADQTVDWLKSQGYDVQLNGGPSQGSLAQCKTTAVHGLRDSNGRLKNPNAFTKVHVSVACDDTV